MEHRFICKNCGMEFKSPWSFARTQRLYHVKNISNKETLETDVVFLKIEYYCDQPNDKVFDSINQFILSNPDLSLARLHYSWIAGKQTILFTQKGDE